MTTDNRSFRPIGRRCNIINATRNDNNNNCISEEVPIRNLNNDLVRKIWNLEAEISNLQEKISDLKYQNRIETEAALMFKRRAEKSEKYIENIQEILFENSEIIPEWIYVKLMNSLIGK
tara:strand:- start:744 stop:1100 length:357 start_codon:yes stop_codon:yes gene_type:complete